MNTNIVNDTLAEYKLSKIIGEGTFGKVHLGIHIPTGQKVAIKILQKEKIVDQSDIERVTREICILKILRHPNIVQLYEIIETKASIHLIMEYAEGGELFDYIVKKRRLNQKQAVNFIQQLLSGIEYIHKNGIVHRDLKPQNLLLDYKGNIKIVDFGLSNQYSSGQKLKTACGSPCYAAPQMIAGKYYECQGVDLWSCGIILFAMLCGYLPFEDQNTNRLYKKILSGDLSLPKYLSEQSKSILKGMLNVDPQRRLKINQIRQTSWYNKINSHYKANGMIVGKDTIQVNKTIFSKIQALGFQTKDLKDYLQNNKHNFLTTLYYLLKAKAEHNCAVNDRIQRQSQSPPKNKPFYTTRLTMNTINRDKRDESLNATKIISSLAQANKGRPILPPNNNKHKLQVFKPFPKQHNPFVTQASNSQVVYRQPLRRRIQSQSQQKRGEHISFKSRSAQKGNVKFNFSPIRQKIVQNARQIPNRINNTFNQTKTINQIHSPSQQKSKILINNKFKIENEFVGTNRENGSQSFHRTINNNNKDSPFIHIGPFNTNCLFMDNPGSMFLKLSAILQKLSFSYKQRDHLTFSLSEAQQISIQSFHGINGYSLIKFVPFTNLSQQIIQILKSS